MANLRLNQSSSRAKEKYARVAVETCMLDILLFTLQNLNVKQPSILFIALIFSVIDGHWTPWENWTSCSATCGIASRFKERFCTSPLYGGVAYCTVQPDMLLEEIDCTSGPCPGGKNNKHFAKKSSFMFVLF